MNWIVFAAGLGYGLWLLPYLFGALFVLGNNDTPLEVTGALAYTLISIPASVIALRRRKLAAFCFTAAAVLWVLGDVTNSIDLAERFSQPLDIGQLLLGLLKSAGPLCAFALFYLLTDKLGWPCLLDSNRAANSGIMKTS